ncbi:MAG: hypothetical protein AAFR38_05360 [Planctomycetota bacterium]
MLRSLTLASALAASAGLTSGNITHKEHDSMTIETPSSKLVGRWAGNASFAVIGPNHIITTKHQGGGVGTTVIIDGDYYRVAEVINHPSADMRICRIENHGGQPADLAEWADIYDRADEMSRPFVIGGFGKDRGADVLYNGMKVGYQWGVRGNLNWGANVVSDTFGLGGSPVPNSLIGARWDPIDTSVPREATVADGDSGCGWFVLDDGQFKLIAITRAVQFGSQARYGERFDGLRMSAFADWIDSVLPEVVAEVPPAEPCGAVDFTEPFGSLTTTDVDAFVNAYFAGEPAAISLVEPLDLGTQLDVMEFVQQFMADCPN